jgi:hypothetical protein
MSVGGDGHLEAHVFGHFAIHGRWIEPFRLRVEFQKTAAFPGRCQQAFNIYLVWGTLLDQAAGRVAQTVECGMQTINGVDLLAQSLGGQAFGHPDTLRDR